MGGRPRVYTAKAGQQAQAHLRIAVQGQLPEGWEPITGPVRLDVLAVLRRPTGLPKRYTRPTRKPDVDNLGKTLMDAIEGLVYDRDSRICDFSLRKLYGDPCWHLTIEELPP